MRLLNQQQADYIIQLFIVSLLTFAGVVDGKYDWNYKETEKWPALCKNGLKQSPIDLNEGVARERAFAPIQFDNFGANFNALIKNNGHSVAIKFQRNGDSSGDADDENAIPSISGGNLTKTYKFDHMHFHWPSEHSINGRLYPLEAHFVHYDSKYKDISETFDKHQGLAVLGVLYKLSPDDDEDLSNIFNAFSNISHNLNEMVPLDASLTLKAFLPRDKAGFFRYDGSLTTPNCAESVIWTVFTNTLPISQRQLNYFRTIHSHSEPLINNHRPIQKLNNRALYLKRSPINSSDINTISLALLIATLCMQLVR